MILFIPISEFIAKTFQFDREFNYIYLIIRGSASIAIIYLIQYTLNLNARNQSVLLQNQMLKTENIRAQFEILKQQISPHFLFNSLSSLRSMIRTSNKNAEDFVIKLSDIYRLLLANKEKDTITLKEELEFIKDYSFLLFARYENMLRIEFDIPDNLLNFKIPTFTLQLLLENCVKHNIVSKEKPLRIRIYDSGLNSLSVENNLQQKIVSGEESGHGLQNLTKRCELLGVSNGIQIFFDESVFRVKIKLLEA
ncbi:MAG: histidine kinase [Bacteroidales bacterium]|nr:histidine kinase [Bacteroidales bacterium]